MFPQIRRNIIRYFIGGRGSVRCYRNRTQGNNRLNHGVLVQRHIGYRISGGHRRVGVKYGIYILALFIAAQMHLNL